MLTMHFHIWKSYREDTPAKHHDTFIAESDNVVMATLEADDHVDWLNRTAKFCGTGNHYTRTHCFGVPEQQYTQIIVDDPHA